MFDTVVADEAPVVGASVDEDWFDPAWLDEVPPLEDGGQVPASRCVPSGWLALELDQGCADPGGLSDAELIEGIIGFDHLASWAGARQAVLLAQFARRRPGDHPLAAGCDRPSAVQTTPTGHTYTSHPHDYRPEPPQPPPSDDPPPF